RSVVVGRIGELSYHLVREVDGLTVSLLRLRGVPPVLLEDPEVVKALGQFGTILRNRGVAFRQGLADHQTSLTGVLPLVEPRRGGEWAVEEVVGRGQARLDAGQRGVFGGQFLPQGQ